MGRATLLINHVLSGESVATDRLKPHSGKRLCILLPGWPNLLPDLPALRFVVTPAGLIEWEGQVTPQDCQLTLRVDASNPASLFGQTLRGQPPQAGIEGDVALAADLAWLAQNLRWDLADDLERLFPLPVAQALHGLGSALMGALRAVVRPVCPPVRSPVGS